MRIREAFRKKVLGLIVSKITLLSRGISVRRNTTCSQSLKIILIKRSIIQKMKRSHLGLELKTSAFPGKCSTADLIRPIWFPSFLTVLQLRLRENLGILHYFVYCFILHKIINILFNAYIFSTEQVIQPFF